MGTVRTAEVEWIGGFTDGEGRIVSTTTGTIPELELTWDARTDVDRTRTSPEELLAAAHAGCFAMQFTHGLVGAGGQPEDMRVSAAVTFEPGVGITTSVLTVRVNVGGLSDDAIREIAERSKLGCPVSRALAGVDISLELPDLAPASEDGRGGSPADGSDAG